MENARANIPTSTEFILSFVFFALFFAINDFGGWSYFSCLFFSFSSSFGAVVHVLTCACAHSCLFVYFEQVLFISFHSVWFFFFCVSIFRRLMTPNRQYWANRERRDMFMPRSLENAVQHFYCFVIVWLPTLALHMMWALKSKCVVESSFVDLHRHRWLMHFDNVHMSMWCMELSETAFVHVQWENDHVHRSYNNCALRYIFLKQFFLHLSFVLAFSRFKETK